MPILTVVVVAIAHCQGAEPMPTKAPPEVEITPAWVTLNQKVLKFTGFFEEEISASTSLERETRRIHHVEVYYYLEDDSLHVSEPRVANSGLPQVISHPPHSCSGCPVHIYGASRITSTRPLSP